MKPVVANKAVDQRVKISVNNTYRMSMQQSVQNLAQTQNTLVNSLDDPVKKQLHLEAVEAKDIANSKATTSQLLELARKISENIRKIERELKVQDLQKAVNMSRDDIFKRVMSLEIAVPEYTGNRIPGSTKVKLVQDMEEHAKEFLAYRQNDIKVRGLGNSALDVKKTDKLNLAYSNGEKDHNLIKGLDSSVNVTGDKAAQHSKNDFVDVWLDHIPPINQETPKKVAGRVLKINGQHADRLFINSWYIIGPFSISGNKMPPDYGIDLDGVYYGKDQKPVSWQYLSNSQYPIILPQADKSGVFFGYTEVTLDREQDLWVWVGADDYVNLELNEKTVWSSEVFNKKFNDLAYAKSNSDRNNWNLTEFKRLVHFKAGINKFKFRLTNSDGPAFFSLVLTK